MDNKKKAILFMLLAAFSFAIMNTFVKLCSEIPVFEKVFFRNLVTLIIMAVVLKKEKKRFLWKKENSKLMWIRCTCGLLGVVLLFYASNNLLLSDSSTLNKLSPFFVTLFAAIFLKEKLSKMQVPALIVVFLSAILIIKPRFDLSVLPALSGFLSAIFAGMSYVTLRLLKDKEDPSTIVFDFALVSVLAMIPLMMFNFKFPSQQEITFLLLIGIFAAISQFSLAVAYKNAPANEIAIYDYSSIIFSSLIGFALWGDIPDVYSIIGSLLIICTSVFLFVYNNKNTQN